MSPTETMSSIGSRAHASTQSVEPSVSLDRLATSTTNNNCPMSQLRRVRGSTSRSRAHRSTQLASSPAVPLWSPHAYPPGELLLDADGRSEPHMCR